MSILANLPFLLLLSNGLLFYFLGWSYISGLIVFVSSIYINGKLARMMSGYQKSYMAA